MKTQINFNQSPGKTVEQVHMGSGGLLVIITTYTDQTFSAVWFDSNDDDLSYDYLEDFTLSPLMFDQDVLIELGIYTKQEIDQAIADHEEQRRQEQIKNDYLRYQDLAKTFSPGWEGRLKATFMHTPGLGKAGSGTDFYLGKQSQTPFKDV